MGHMPPSGSGADEDLGVAQRLAAEQRAISVAEFFEKNKHMLGFDSGARALVTAVKEGVDNALDAAEEANILPDIYVDIEDVGDYYRLVIEDNGPGITADQVPKIFGKMLYGSRFHKRQQNRGQQGIGISAAVLYAQLTSGKPARITSKPKGSDRARYFELVIDTDANEPDIRAEEATTWDRPHGTRLEIELEANMRARSQLHRYIEQTAIVNPHARIELREPKLDEPRKFERATDQLPAETAEIQPHPHGVELGTLIKMLEATDSYSLSGFLQAEFTRVGRTTAENVVANFLDRHAGRELAWSPPGAHENLGFEAAVGDAIVNKGEQATAMFVDELTERLGEHERVAHGDLASMVESIANDVEAATDKRFGSTVRDNALSAAWGVITGAAIDADRLSSDLYVRIDRATSDRKDDRTVDGWATRLAERIDAADSRRHRFTREELADLIDAAADGTETHDGATIGETARDNVTAALWNAMRRVDDDPPSVSTVADDRDLAAAFLEGMRATDIMAPPTDCLAPITADLIEAGLRKEIDAAFFAANTRDADVHGGDPFLVEAGIAYGGELEDEGAIDLQRFANRVPLVYQRGACATTDVVRSIDWRNYKLDQPGGSGMPSGPVALVIHVASTNVPFTSESKDAVANVPAIEHEIELAVREVAREMKRHVSKRRSLQQRRQKEDVIARVLPEMADKVASVLERDRPNVDAALARIMNNVHVTRRVEGDTVTLRVRNFDDTAADLEVTDILDVEPESVADGARVTEMDGSWYVRWEPAVAGGETASVTYVVSPEASNDLAVSGPPTEKLTIDHQ